MNVKSLSWIDALEQLIQKKHMLLSPFYQAWAEGKLLHTTLQQYAKEYYQHIRAFPTYISALHSRSGDPRVRRCLLTNLIDEEAGHPNHPELWNTFALGLGVEQTDLETHAPKKETRELIDHFRSTCNTHPVVVGLAALYCYESQIPEICKTKIDGLKKWYGVTDPEKYLYFTEHETADVEHSRAEKELLLALVRPEEENAVLEGAEKTLDCLRQFLGSFPL
jgi:pyrroloquinoline-quinone synthase